MKVGDLVKRDPEAYSRGGLRPNEIRDIGIITGFDEAQEYWTVIVYWMLCGESWETPDDIEVIT